MLADLQGDLLPALDAFVEATRLTAREKATKPIRDKLEKAMAKAFRAQGAALLKGLKQYRKRFPVEESMGAKDWAIVFGQASEETLELFSAPMLAAVRQALKVGGDQFVASMGVDEFTFSVANPGAVRYIEEVGGARIRGINDETQKVIQGILNNGARDGWSYDHVAREIKNRFEEFAIGKPQEHIDSRAHLVAVTEIGEAYEEASFLAAEDLNGAGVSMEKAWQTLGDTKVSAGCRGNEADGWIPMDQPHSSGHQHPLRFPGCRCGEKYRRKRG